MGDINSINKDFLDLFTQADDLLQQNSSDYVNTIRKEAISKFKILGVPSKSDETYKYTDLVKVLDHEYSVDLQYRDQKSDLNKLFYCDVPELDTNLVLFSNGWYYKENKKLDIPKEVIICSFQEAALNHTELFNKHYAKYADISSDGMMALNTAMAKDGLFVYVPKGIVVNRPIQVISLLNSTKDLMTSQRNLIIVEENAQVKFIFSDHALARNKYLTNSLTEVYVGPSAVFDMYILQNQHMDTAVINTICIQQERNSNVLTNTLSLHGGFIRNNHLVKLNGEHCENNTYGMYLLDRDQHVDNYTAIDHLKPNCISNEHYKGVMDDDSFAAFTGRITVHKDAQKTLAYQSNNNLLLSDNAQINSKPQLIIDADDVKCSHGATVGQMDEEALFYLKARGINEIEAKQMLMFAFAHEIIGKIRIEALKERIDEIVDKRLRGGSSLCKTCSLQCDN